MTQLKSLADAPNTLREYETIYILNPDTANDMVGEVNDKVKGLIEERGGKILKVDNWGKRRLSYEIAKQRKGIYLYWQYLGNPAIVSEFERNMRMLDSVLRYLTVRIDEDVDPNARPSELEDDSFERAAATAADEEDRMLGEVPFVGDGADEEDGDASAEAKPAEAAAAEAKPAEAAEATEAKPAEAAEATETAAAPESSESTEPSDDGTK